MGVGWPSWRICGNVVPAKDYINLYDMVGSLVKLVKMVVNVNILLNKKEDSFTTSGEKSSDNVDNLAKSQMTIEKFIVTITCSNRMNEYRLLL